MRHAAWVFAIALPAAAIASGAPVSEPEKAAVQSLDLPSYELPAQKWKSVEDAELAAEQCRDRIHWVRKTTGQPDLKRETADPGETHLIWAVDRRLDGCSVMVIKGDTDDVRPLPKPDTGPLLRRIPAEAVATQ